MSIDGHIDALFRAALLGEIAARPPAKRLGSTVSQVALRRRLTGEGLFRCSDCSKDQPPPMSPKMSPKTCEWLDPSLTPGT